LGDVVLRFGLGRLMGDRFMLEVEVEVAVFGWEGISDVLCCDVGVKRDRRSEVGLKVMGDQRVGRADERAAM